jgi:hypothetical protein
MWIGRLPLRVESIRGSDLGHFFSGGLYILSVLLDIVSFLEFSIRIMDTMA